MGDDDRRRPYRSPVRERQAEATRRAVLAAATTRFAERGYAATTVVEIAVAAGVTKSTVYASVGGKAALALALAEDPDGVLAEVRARTAVLEDPRQVLRLTAHGAGEAVRRRQPAWTFLLDGRAEDPAVQAAAEAALAAFREHLDAAADRLHALAPHPDLTRARVRQILWYYLGVQSWRTLRGLGWGWDGAARWLADQAEAAVLPVTASGRGSP